MDCGRVTKEGKNEGLPKGDAVATDTGGHVQQRGKRLQHVHASTLFALLT
jgi:hypothetical protein